MNKILNLVRTYFPVTKGEIYAISIIISGLIISIISDYFHGNIITDELRKEIVEVSDSLNVIEQKVKGEILININTATIDDLMLLKGIGEKTANKIISYRNQNRFTNKEDLLNVKGIGPKKLENIIDFIEIDSTKRNK